MATAPTITSNGGGDTATINVPENTLAITTVTAFDPDPGTTLNYSIIGGPDQFRLTINSSTGALSFFDPIYTNFESPADQDHNGSYVVQVKASDGVLFDTQTITAVLTDVNEPPVISGGSVLSVPVNENNTSVTRIQASDPDNGTVLTYSVVGGADQNKFTLNTSTGLLTFVAPPDFENPTDADRNNSYVIQIRTSDGQLFADQTIIANIDNVNEPPVIVSNGGVSTPALSIPENTSFVTQVVATDPDTNTTLTYHIFGGSSIFQIDADTGILSFIAPPDYEASQFFHSFSVGVSASDGVISSSVQFINVSVTNVNEPPTITSDGGGDQANLSITENSTSVSTVHATDPDFNTVLSYGVVGGADASNFQLDGASGSLSFIHAPDFERPTDSDHNNSYVVQVSASDGSLSDTQTITINVADVNEVVRSDFNGDGFSDALFRNDAIGAFGWTDVHNASTFHNLGFSSVSYSVGGIGDFNADGFADILFRNGADGDFGYTDAHNGSTWHNIGRSDAAYAVAGIEDFNHDGFADVLFRNNSGGDFGYTDVRNGSAWHDIGPSDTSYAVVGGADFNGDGFADILFRNAAGNFGYTDAHNASAWHDTGHSDPAYAVARAADFNGDGFADVLFRNNATGDFGYSDIHNGSAWHDIGPSDTAYGVAGVADFNGDGFADVLFRNDATGDFGYTDVHNGSAWHEIGPSTTSWHLV